MQLAFGPRGSASRLQPLLKGEVPRPLQLHSRKSAGAPSHPALRGLAGLDLDACPAQPRSPSAPYSRALGEMAPGPAPDATPGTHPAPSAPGQREHQHLPAAETGRGAQRACCIPGRPHRSARGVPTSPPSLCPSLARSLPPSSPPAPDKLRLFSWGARPCGRPSHPAKLWDSSHLVLNVPLRERMAGEARCGPGPRGPAVREAVLLLLCLGVPSGRPYNVDTESALLYQGPPNTLFGYSVVLHSHAANRWLIVGAPTANWLANASVVSPGAIYRCRIAKNPDRTCEQLQLGSPSGEPCGKTCLEERDNQWLGVTLSRQPGENGSVVVGYWNRSTDNIMKSGILGVTYIMCSTFMFYSDLWT